MFDFNVGAGRPARNGVRPDAMNAANDLVRRTLAQHGLMPGSSQGDGKTDVMATVQQALAQAGLHKTKVELNAQPLVEGAIFATDTYAGKSGSRSFRTYVPASATQGVAGIILMLHGCTQTPEDFATGTGMNALAEKHRLVVIYPGQARGANAQSCWNWFSPNDQSRDRGEPAILAGMMRDAMAAHDVPRNRCFVAGLSAGAAMAVILGGAYPDVFAAVGAHSGLPLGAARDVPSAFAAMAGSAANAPMAQVEASDLRTIVFHGTADATVNPANGDAIARQAEARASHQTNTTQETGSAVGRTFTRVITSAPDGSIRLEHWKVEGLGHAWSGGQPGGSYTDAKGPDASAEMVRFFLQSDS